MQFETTIKCRLTIYLPEHMPEKHRRYLQYNADGFREWAEQVGTSALIVVNTFLTMHKVEQQGYKPCASLMRLADQYTAQRLENACAKALSYTPNPSLKNITTILKSGQDKVPKPSGGNPSKSASYGITRGASYFKGGES